MTQTKREEAIHANDMTEQVIVIFQDKNKDL